MSNREFTAQRTMLANAFATAGAELLEYMGTAAALAAIPNTEPPQYVVAGTLQMIVKVLPSTAAEKPAGGLTDEQIKEIGLGNAIDAFEVEQFRASQCSGLTAPEQAAYTSQITFARAIARAAIAAYLARQAQATGEPDLDSRIVELRTALRQIGETRFDWDGDCGVTKIADDALYADEQAEANRAAAPASQEGAHAALDEVRNQALEEAALAAEKVQDEYRESQSGKWPELRDDAATGAGDCVEAIRALKTPASAEKGGA